MKAAQAFKARKEAAGIEGGSSGDGRNIDELEDFERSQREAEQDGWAAVRLQRLQQHLTSVTSSSSGRGGPSEWDAMSSRRQLSKFMKAYRQINEEVLNDERMLGKPPPRPQLTMKDNRVFDWYSAENKSCGFCYEDSRLPGLVHRCGATGQTGQEACGNSGKEGLGAVGGFGFWLELVGGR